MNKFADVACRKKDIQKKINDVIDENGWRARVKDVFCHGDPANFGIIEFHTPASAKSFLRRLAKMTGLEIEAGKVMKFSANRTLLQRAADKRLGMIKHLLAQLEGTDLKDVKISWKANVVRLKSEIVCKRTSNSAGRPVLMNAYRFHQSSQRSFS